MGARLNSRELWRVFYCLFRACIGLAYGMLLRNTALPHKCIEREKALAITWLALFPLASKSADGLC